MVSTPPILIAGGGIGGLAAALALARHQRNSIVLEARPRFQSAGAGIQIGPNGVWALRGLGVADVVRSAACEPQSLRVVDGRSTQTLAVLPLGSWITRRHGAPYWTMHRHDLHASLLAAASANPAVTLRMAFTVASVSQRKREVEVVGEHGETLVGSALIGADGFRSTIRSTICPSARLDFAKVTATRTLVPVENAGKSREAAVGLWLSRGINVVHYPVRGGSHIAFVIIAAESRQEECEDAGPVQLPQLVQRLHPDLAAILDAGREWQKRPLYTLGPLPRWSDRRVTLIGDAAHPMLPHVAQGGVLALEDALILGDRVAAQPEEAEAFQSFEAVRRQRANSMQRVSRLNGRLYHMGPPLSWARNAVLRSLRSAWLMARYDWIYGWKAS